MRGGWVFFMYRKRTAFSKKFLEKATNATHIVSTSKLNVHLRAIYIKMRPKMCVKPLRFTSVNMTTGI